jgi:multidrug efflux pump subunit AcrA (membrane-fusion protein)
MKRNQIIILGGLLLIFALIFISIASKKKSSTKELKTEETTIYVPVQIVNNASKEMQIISYGQVTPMSEIDVAVEVQGKLKQGALVMKPGVSFSKGQVLYRVDNEEAFFTLSARKVQLSNLVVSAMPDIELDFPGEKNKWLDFLNSIKASSRLPEIPSFGSSKERMFMTARGVLADYYNIKSLESRMEKYVYIAPFSGTVIETYAEPGAIANPGTRIARIAKTNDFEIKVPISIDNIANYQKQGSVKFFNSDGLMVGTGTINRVSAVINQQTQSVDVYYNIRPVSNQKIYSGLFLNAAINQSVTKESITVPRMAVDDSKINILIDGKVVQRSIQIVGNKPDSLYVSGLENGERVILEKIEMDKKGKTFKGIVR